MHSVFFRLFLLLGAATLAVASPGAPAVRVAAKSPDTKSTEVKRHPLRGVITAVDAATSSLMVKHEEIPGVMRAMTMRFKVAPAVLQTVKKGQAITGLMSRQGNEWWLENVKPAPAKREG